MTNVFLGISKENKRRGHYNRFADSESSKAKGSIQIVVILQRPGYKLDRGGLLAVA